MIIVDNETNYNTEDLKQIVAEYFKEVRLQVIYFQPSSEYVEEFKAYSPKEIMFVRFDKDHKVGGRYSSIYNLRLVKPKRLMEQLSPMEQMTMETSGELPVVCARQVHYRMRIMMEDRSWKARWRSVWPTEAQRNQNKKWLELHYVPGRLDEAKITQEKERNETVLAFKSSVHQWKYDHERTVSRAKDIINYEEMVARIRRELPGEQARVSTERAGLMEKLETMRANGRVSELEHMELLKLLSVGGEHAEG